MKKLVALFIAVAFLVMMVAVYVYAAEGGKPAASKFNYVGVKKCKMCHKTKKSGSQFGLWEKRGHARAYATLATEQSKEVAKKAGVKDDPQKAKECLVCHVTAYDVPAAQKMATLTLEEGVSCEACHGPGSAYMKLKVMKDLYAKKANAEDYGYVRSDEKVCLKCHNPKSPTYKKFVFTEALKVIAHPVPEK